MKSKELMEATEASLSKLTDEELLSEAKKLKSFSINNAFIVGFFIGILVYSFVKNSWGLLTLIPLYLIHKIVSDPKNARAKVIKKLVRERNLK